MENGDCGERRIVSVAASSVDKSSESSHLETKGFPRTREGVPAEVDLVGE